MKKSQLVYVEIIAKALIGISASSAIISQTHPYLSIVICALGAAANEIITREKVRIAQEEAKNENI